MLPNNMYIVQVVCVSDEFVQLTDVVDVSSSVQLLAPHVRVWDSVSLNTLHVIGMGVFDRAVTCVAFSKSVSSFTSCRVYRGFNTSDLQTNTSFFFLTVGFAF